MAPQIKTLKDLMIVAPMFGQAATAWVQNGIDKAPLGEDEPIEAEDNQLMALLLQFQETEDSFQQQD